MRVFISHSVEDTALARDVAQSLAAKGLSPWLLEENLFLGDNPAAAHARALEESQAMVALITPSSAHSPWVRHELGYALSNRGYKGRVIPLVVGSPQELGPDAFPWVLKAVQVARASSRAELERAVRSIADALALNTPSEAA